MTSWVLIANGSEARIYSRSADSEDLKMVNEFNHPESRMKSGELISDRSGHFQSNTKSMGHGSYEEATPAKEHEMELFAKEIADSLDKGRVDGKFNKLVLISPPHFSGLLNRHLNKDVKTLVANSVGKDYTKVSDHDLMNQVVSYL